MSTALENPAGFVATTVGPNPLMREVARAHLGRSPTYFPVADGRPGLIPVS